MNVEGFLHPRDPEFTPRAQASQARKPTFRMNVQLSLNRPTVVKSKKTARSPTSIICSPSVQPRIILQQNHLWSLLLIGRSELNAIKHPARIVDVDDEVGCEQSIESQGCQPDFAIVSELLQ